MYPYRRQPNNPYDKGNKNRQNVSAANSGKSDLDSFQRREHKAYPAPSVSEFTAKARSYYKFGDIKTACNEKDDYDDSDNMDTPAKVPETEPADRDFPDEINQYIIEMVTEAIKDGMADSGFYGTIANMLGDENDSKIFYKIVCDKKKHEKIFAEIYEMLTGNSFSDEDTKCDRKPVSENMAENFSNAIFDELSNVEFYRKLYFAFLNTELRDALFEIITDTQAHAQILNYMYSKYSR